MSASWSFKSCVYKQFQPTFDEILKHWWFVYTYTYTCETDLTVTSCVAQSPNRPCFMEAQIQELKSLSAHDQSLLTYRVKSLFEFKNTITTFMFVEFTINEFGMHYWQLLKSLLMFCCVKFTIVNFEITISEFTFLEFTVVNF